MQRLSRVITLALFVLALAITPACGRIQLPGGQPTATPIEAVTPSPAATGTVGGAATTEPTTSPEASPTAAETATATPESTATSAPTAVPTTEATPTGTVSGAARRINFAPGTDGISVQGALQPRANAVWVLNARQGQTLSVRVLPVYGSASLGVRGADGTVLLNESSNQPSWSGVLPKSQDYYLRVRAWNNTVVNYILEVVIPVTPAVRRVQFAPGADRAIVQGSLAAGNIDWWLVNARQGQTMTVQVTPGGGQMTLFIRGEDGTVLLSEGSGALTWTGQLPSTQDYVVQVRASPQGPASYSLNVHIPAGGTGTGTAPATATPRRIEFAPGADRATVQGSLPAFGNDAWVLNARQGQTMTVTLTTTTGEALLIIFGADGTVLISDHAEATSWTGPLPSTQDYSIHVRAGPDGPATYTMQVVIPPST